MAGDLCCDPWSREWFRFWAVVLAPVLVAAAAGPVTAQSTSAQGDGAKKKGERVVVLTVDQLTRRAMLKDGYGGEERTLRSGATARVRMTDSVVVRVVNSNSALYRCEVTDSAVAVPQLDSARKFVGMLGGYAMDLPLVFLRPDPADPNRKDLTESTVETHPAIKDVIARVVAVDSIMQGPKGIYAVRSRTLAVLDSLRGESTINTALLPAALDAPTVCADAACMRLNAPTRLLASLGQLAVAYHTLSRARDTIVAEARVRGENAATNAWLETLPAREQMRRLGDLSRPAAVREQMAKAATDSAIAAAARIDSTLGAAKEILEDREALLTAAYEVETMTRRTAAAKSTLECSSVAVSGDKGRALTLRVVPRAEAYASRLALHEEYKLVATVMPEWGVRPQVGLALLVARQAAYPKFAAVTQPDSTVVVARQGTVDNRAMYGLVLGLTHRRLTWEEHGLAIWAPEIVLNPESSMRALGFGGGLSYRFLRLSGGWLWTKHTVLDGQIVGQTITDASALSTRDAYGRPKGYASLALVGWPPFLPTFGSDD